MGYHVPYINLGLQFSNLESELTSEFIRIMKNGSFVLRDDVKQFEENMAKYLGVKQVIGVNSGTDALYLSLDALDIGPGDEVITVANSFVATIASIVRRGAKPILLDIGKDFNMNVHEVESKISSKTRAIMPVHLNGRVCEMDKLEHIAKKYDLLIIEDAAQAIGAEYKGKKAGSFGIAGCFSTHPMKTLSCAGDGGFISTNDSMLSEKLRILRDHGQKNKGEFLCFGYNSRLDNLQAAILNIKFKHLNEYIDRRREIALTYNSRLEDLPLILPPKPNRGDFFDTYNSYTIRTERRDELRDHLLTQGIESFVHMSKPLCKHEGLCLKEVMLPMNERICRENLSLPIYPEITNKQLDYVINSLHKFFGERKE